MAETSRLPVPRAEAWDWQRWARCRAMDSAVFFHPDGERGLARANRVARAKAICHQCPVMRQCRRHALRTREPFGVWGGLDETERHEILTGRRPSPTQHPRPEHTSRPEEGAAFAPGRILAATDSGPALHPPTAGSANNPESLTASRGPTGAWTGGSSAARNTAP